MIKINPSSAQIDADSIRALASIDTNEIGHKRFWGVMSPTLRPVIPGRRAAGTAVTLAIPAFDSALIPYVLSMVRPGDFLVIDRLGDERHSCLGGTVTLAAKIAGVAGIVVDGYATDFEEIIENGVPVWCKGAAALTTKLLGIGGAINVPVSCGGVAVNPGDAVIADESGICILRPDEVQDVILASRAKPARDRAERLRAGEKLADLNGCKARVDAVLAEQEAARKKLIGKIG
jgi:4-hydroxy-4-methyl-2-oxoglutarate aldolase